MRKQELDQYLAFLISRLVNNKYQEPVHVTSKKPEPPEA